MSSKKTYYILLTVLLVAGINLITGVYIANKELAKHAQGLTALKAKTKAQELQQQTLNKVKKDIQTYSELKKITQAIVPEDKNQAAAVREIVKIADENNVTLSNITFPASTLGNAPGGKATTTTTTPTPAASAAITKAAGLSQLTPVKGIPGVYELTITVQNDAANPVSYDDFLKFLAGLEKNRRTAQVSSITLQPTAENSNFLTFNLNITEYIKP
jgi:hypothetical protein